MTVKKVLIIDDHPRQHHCLLVPPVRYKKNKWRLDSENRPVPSFKDTQEGMEMLLDFQIALQNEITRQQELGNKGDVPEFEFDFKYAYPKIPEVKKENQYNISQTSYEKPKVSETNLYKDAFREMIAESDYDLIIPTGAIAINYLLGSGGIMKSRGIFYNQTVNDVPKAIFPCLSRLYVNVQSKHMQKYREDCESVARFLLLGETSQEKIKKNPTILGNSDFDKVVEIFKELKTKGQDWRHPLGVDYETNTNLPQRDGARIITVSFSWEKGQGVTFPVDHKYMPWTEEQKSIIMRGLKQLLQDNRWLVFHNGSFDTRFSKFVMEREGYGRPILKNVLDTMVAHYLAFGYDSNVPRGLKNLAEQWTDLGDYDAELDTFLLWFYKATKNSFPELEGASFMSTYYAYKNEGTPIPEKAWLPYLTEEDKEYVLMVAEDLYQQFDKHSDVTNVLAKGKKQPCYEWIPYRILAQYATTDPDATVRIYDHMVSNYIEGVPDFQRLLTEHYPELMQASTDLEVNGIQIDIDYHTRMTTAYKTACDSLLEEISDLEPVKDINADRENLYLEFLKLKAKKPAERDKERYAYLYGRFGTEAKKKARRFQMTANDIRELLFTRMGYTLPIEKDYITEAKFNAYKAGKISADDLNPSGFRVSADAIQYLMREKDLPKNVGKPILEYLKINKGLTTYTTGILDYCDSNNVLHGTLNIVGTDTTRLSSSNPNLQNFTKPGKDPKLRDYRYPVKRSFIPHYSKGQNVLMNLDYSSQEAHLVALLGHDEQMIEAFVEGRDVHSETAAMVFGVPVEEVTGAQRTMAKSTTFGLMYGETPESYFHKHTTLDAETGEERPMTLEEARELFDKYFAEKPKIKDIIDASQKEAEQLGYSRVPFSGYRRNLENVNSSEFSTASKAVRQALNAKVQGGSAYMTQMSMIYINRWLKTAGVNACVVLNVHDSITLSVAMEDLEKVARGCTYIMENLPIDEFQTTLHGKPLKFKIEAEPEVGSAYAFETDLDMDFIQSFKSMHGVSMYNEQLHRLSDRKDKKYISKEKYEVLKARVESHISKYQELESPWKNRS